MSNGRLNPVIDFINTLCNFFVLNLIFLITCLPVFTIGSALASLLCNEQGNKGRIRLPCTYLYPGIQTKLQRRNPCFPAPLYGRRHALIQPALLAHERNRAFIRYYGAADCTFRHMAGDFPLHISIGRQVCKYACQFHQKCMGAGCQESEMDGCSASDRCVYGMLLPVYFPGYGTYDIPVSGVCIDCIRSVFYI